MEKIVDNLLVKQFVSYFFVGGLAAIIEWIMFALFANLIGINYIFATCLAFIFSTATNWGLGRIWTFKDNQSYVNQKVKEAVLIFSVSVVGLLFNIGLMYLFVSVLKLDTAALKTLSKIMATGIVFFWNFLIRKTVIYK